MLTGITRLGILDLEKNWAGIKPFGCLCVNYVVATIDTLDFGTELQHGLRRKSPVERANSLIANLVCANMDAHDGLEPSRKHCVSDRSSSLVSYGVLSEIQSL